MNGKNGGRSAGQSAPVSSLCRGSTATTRGVRVKVAPGYLPEHSDPEPQPGQERRFVFAYEIEIENLGVLDLVLRARRWIIIDGDGERHEVEGEGVVGQQPHLSPGRLFRYESFCPLSTPWGTMEGWYSMEVRAGPEAGRLIDVHVARFILAAPDADAPH